MMMALCWVARERASERISDGRGGARDEVLGPRRGFFLFFVFLFFVFL
jgi:hypothetical protein